MSSEGPRGKAVLANGKEWVEGEAEKGRVGSQMAEQGLVWQDRAWPWPSSNNNTGAR